MVRKKAYEILCSVLINDGYASLSLKQLQGYSTVDTNLIVSIVYGVLRNYDLCTFQYQKFLKKSISKKHEILLSMSIYQLFFLDKVPEYAVVNEAVELVKSYDKGFINAILHKCIDQGLIYSESEDSLYDLSINTSIPLWIIKMWNKQYSKEICEEICNSYLDNEALVYRINPLKITKEDLQKDYEVEFFDDYAFVSKENLIKTDLFTEGKVVVQDFSSQNVVHVLDPKENQMILDVCSAPGSKSMFIGSLMKNTGKIIALDIYDHRLALIKEAISRQGITNCEVYNNDATVLNKNYLDSFDSVLVDAPCSGLGTLRKKPEIKYHLLPSDIDEIVVLQKKILEVSSNYVKKGGSLVYSTCTLNKKENDNQIKEFLKVHNEFELIEEKTLYPFDFNQDGFYCAKLLKVL